MSEQKTKQATTKELVKKIPKDPPLKSAKQPTPVSFEIQMQKSLNNEITGVQQSLSACVEEEKALNQRLASVRNRAQQLLGAKTALEVQLSNLNSFLKGAKHD